MSSRTALRFALSALALVAMASTATHGEDATPEEVVRLVAQLASDDFETREKAVPALIAAGKPALTAVEQAALAGESETRFRAVTILAAWSRGSDAGLSEGAQKSLGKVAAGDDPTAARQASDALKYFTRVDLMRKLAEALALSTVEDGRPKTKLPLKEKHLHRFVDLDRLNLDGTLWAVGEKGRPLAVMEVFPGDVGDGQERWWTAVASLTDQPLIAENVDVLGQNWTPEGWGEAFRPFPKAAAPAESAQERQAQAAALARRFTAHQFWRPGETRYELTVNPDPVLRYDDEKAGIVDGSLLILMHDTNPEVLLLIEAQLERGKAQWKYALASLGSARMHVQLDQEEVWTRPTPANVAGGGTLPYWVFVRVTPAEAK
jgi:hypothetical protein